MPVDGRSSTPPERSISPEREVPITLDALLALDRIDEDLYRAPARRPTSMRMFGGAVAAQALLAAGRTVDPARAVHSLHAYFLRPADTALPFDFRVTQTRDGGSFTTRQVTAEQGGRAVLTLSASFQVPEDGLEHQVPRLDAPPPDRLPAFGAPGEGADPAVREALDRIAQRHRFDLRFDGEPLRVATGRGERVPPRQRFWLRSQDPLPDDPLLHGCALAYASDMLLLSTSVAPHGLVIGSPGLVWASLDHAVWFHRPVRADDWLCYDQESSWAAGGRTLCSGRMFDRDGRLAVTVVQEGLIRRRPAGAVSG